MKHLSFTFFCGTLKQYVHAAFFSAKNVNSDWDLSSSKTKKSPIKAVSVTCMLSLSSEVMLEELTKLDTYLLFTVNLHFSII